jgi:hypothetical protein
MFESNSELWANSIFGQADLNDKRRTKRLVKLTVDMADGAGKSVVRASKDPASIEGAYRFIENDNIDPKAIAQAGFDATAKECAERRLILALEDTTGLSYTHDVCDELGNNPAGKNRAVKGRSLFQHSILAMDADTEKVIGLAHQQNYTRSELPQSLKNSGSARSRRSKEEKDSYRWEESSVSMHETFTRTDNIIHVCDREADSYEYMDQHLDSDRRFIIRCQHNRALQLEAHEENVKLKALIDFPHVAEHTLKIVQKGKGKTTKNRPARIATMGVSYHQVTFKRTHDADKNTRDEISLNLVVCRELDPQDEASRLCWFLYTNEPINSVAEAQEIVRYYELRWRIEDFHKTWKSDGTQVEKLRLGTRKNTERLSTILAFVAVRLMQLKEMAENTEEAKQQSCETMFTSLEWKMLWKESEKTKSPSEPPSLYWAYYALAKLGGWHDSKRTGKVGMKAIWAGWVDLMLMLKGYRLMAELDI